MKLSVIIVNYNVKHFLEQCLISVLAAAEHCDCEVFVVDNNSVDGSCAMVKSKFPQVILIENKKNFGFSYANNQAIRESKGEYVLLLNPDTVVQEYTFKLVCDFMDSHPDAGGLGVKMIDGKGRFLPESKRGLPTPEVAFYKIFGLSKIFKNSRRFGQYHLNYLSKDEIHKIDVLSGAFMLLRRSVLDEIGLLDESFFMYGEDIDISYRIIKAGYNNYYFPGTTIIHYKGESTKKGSINYVVVFYNAMIIFAKKHFSGRNAGIMIAMIKLAIYFRALLAIFYRFGRSIITPLVDATIIISGFLVLTPLWAELTHGVKDYYPEKLLYYALAGYVLIWLFSLLFSGGYDRPVKIKNVYRGILAGTIMILALYSLLPVEYRFSRALILLGSAWTILLLPLTRLLLGITGRSVFEVSYPQKKRVAIVGSKKESEDLIVQLNNKNPRIKIVAFVNPNENSENNEFFAGNLSQLEEIIQINKIDEIIFCSKDLTAQQIIQTMLSLNNSALDYKIASPDGFSVIGSNSINTTAELYNIDINSIIKPENKRNKRVLDFVISLVILMFFPILIFFIRKPWRAFVNLLNILQGNKSFVAYYDKNIDTTFLPKIKKGVFTTADLLNEKDKNIENINSRNIMYAKDYKIIQDLFIILKSWKNLGQD